MANESNVEKQIGNNVASIGSDSGIPAGIDKAAERRLVWKQDALIMPALGTQIGPPLLPRPLN